MLEMQSLLLNQKTKSNCWLLGQLILMQRKLEVMQRLKTLIQQVGSVVFRPSLSKIKSSSQIYQNLHLLKLLWQEGELWNLVRISLFYTNWPRNSVMEQSEQQEQLWMLATFLETCKLDKQEKSLPLNFTLQLESQVQFNM